MSASKAKHIEVRLKFGPSVITPEQRAEAHGALRGLLCEMSHASLSLTDKENWIFTLKVPEGTRFGILLFGGTFELVGPQIPWKARERATQVPAPAEV